VFGRWQVRQHAGVDYVRVECSTDGWVTTRIVEEHLENSGAYSWRLVSPPGTYSVRIVTVYDGGLSGASEARALTIVEQECP
jgi:hypothetical protein